LVVLRGSLVVSGGAATLPGSEQNAVVTGAGRGIGQAVARRLARDGFRVTVIDRDRDVAKETAVGIRDRGGVAEAVALDIRDRDAARAVYARLGEVHVLVNNAAIASDMVAFADLTGEQLREMMEVNLLGTFVMAQEAARCMPEGGRIVNIASRGYLGGAGASHYVASKAGVVGLTRAMCVELRWRGISVNCVAPGMTDTRMMASFTDDMRAKLARREPRGRAASPAEIASAVAFFASSDAGFVNGQILLVDGGKTVGMPQF
jgi:3-oxoacyl-[acyl-carrier protein] reductase